MNTLTITTDNLNVLDLISRGLNRPAVIDSEINSSLASVNAQTDSMKIKAITDFLIANKGRKFLATFIKKDGSIRTIKFVPRNGYNRMMGITSTEWGKAMVAHKAWKDMLTVVEFFKDDHHHDCVQCRTLNLRTITDLRLAA